MYHPYYHGYGYHSYGGSGDRFFGIGLLPFAAGALTGALLSRPFSYPYPYPFPYPYPYPY